MAVFRECERDTESGNDGTHKILGAVDGITDPYANRRIRWKCVVSRFFGEKGISRKAVEGLLDDTTLDLHIDLHKELSTLTSPNKEEVEGISLMMIPPSKPKTIYIDDVKLER